MRCVEVDVVRVEHPVLVRLQVAESAKDPPGVIGVQGGGGLALGDEGARGRRVAAAFGALEKNELCASTK